jgi:hypothetical protein
MASNIATNAATGQGGNSGSFAASGQPVNPVLVCSASDDYAAAQMILSETHGALAEMIRIAEVLRNRVLIAQAGQSKKAGTPNAPTVTGQILAPGQFSGYNGITGYAGGKGANYLATKTYTGNEPEFQKALQAWMTAKAGSNLTNGATNFWATSLGNRGMTVQAVGSENLFLSPNNGYTYQSAALQAAGSTTNSPSGPVQASSPGQYVANNVRNNNAAQFMISTGHNPTVAEASIVGLPNFPPTIAQAWARAMANKRGHMTIRELIARQDQDSAAWQMFASTYMGTVTHPSLSPIEHLNAWVHSFFRANKNVAMQKWNPLAVNTNFTNSVNPASLSSNIASSLLTAITAINNTWSTSGPDGPIAHGVQNVMANLLTPVSLATVQPTPAATNPSPSQTQLAQANTLQLTSVLGDPVTLALHSEDILNNLATTPSSVIIANLAFPGATNISNLTSTTNGAVVGASA